jgi:hypothetical protein
MSDSTGDEARKINVLVVGESPNLFSLFRPLAKVDANGTLPSRAKK